MIVQIKQALRRFLIKSGITLVALLITLSSSAQANTLLAYANATIGTENSTYSAYHYRVTTWGINPGIGYQFNRYFTAGIQTANNYMRTPVGAAHKSDFTITGITVGAFARYTYYTKSIFFIYAQVDVGYSTGSIHQETLGKQGSYSGMNAMLYPAVGAFITKDIAINLNIGGVAYYNKDWSSNSVGITNEDRFIFNIGRQFSLGVSKNISLRKKPVTVAPQ